MRLLSDHSKALVTTSAFACTLKRPVRSASDHRAVPVGARETHQAVQARTNDRGFVPGRDDDADEWSGIALRTLGGFVAPRAQATSRSSQPARHCFHAHEAQQDPK